MKYYFFVVCFLCIFFVSCVKNYKFTANVCDGKLFAENFNVNPAGIDATYLTDSVNFRLYIGKFDNEHENFHFVCKGDTLIIEKIASLDTTGIMKVIETRIFNLQQLRKEKKFE